MGQASAPSALTSAHADPAASSSLAPLLPPSVPAPSSCCVSGVYSLASASSPPSRDGMASRVLAAGPAAAHTAFPTPGCFFLPGNDGG